MGSAKLAGARKVRDKSSKLGRIEHDGISITVGTAARNIALEDWTIIAHGTALASVHYTTI